VFSNGKRDYGELVTTQVDGFIRLGNIFEPVALFTELCVCLCVAKVACMQKVMLNHIQLLHS